MEDRDSRRAYRLVRKEDRQGRKVAVLVPKTDGYGLFEAELPPEEFTKLEPGRDYYLDLVEVERG